MKENHLSRGWIYWPSGYRPFKMYLWLCPLSSRRCTWRCSHWESQLIVCLLFSPRWLDCFHCLTWLCTTTPTRTRPRLKLGLKECKAHHSHFSRGVLLEIYTPRNTPPLSVSLCVGVCLHLQVTGFLHIWLDDLAAFDVFSVLYCFLSTTVIVRFRSWCVSISCPRVTSSPGL